jgi:hypothetical protein
MEATMYYVEQDGKGTVAGPYQTRKEAVSRMGELAAANPREWYEVTERDT